MSQVLLIGDIVNDVSLNTGSKEPKMRLGGIVHAARALWALDIEYSVAYFAPSYLDNNIRAYLQRFNCSNLIKLGNVVGCPYTMLINEVKEIGDQGYEFLLRDDISIEYDVDTLSSLLSYDGQVLCVMGNYQLDKVMPMLKNASVNIDGTNNIHDFQEVAKYRYDTVFLSTSSIVFKQNEKPIAEFLDDFKNVCNRVVLKENRGGSRAIDFLHNIRYEIPSQTTSIAHSVGIGDAYDATTVALFTNYSLEDALFVASWVAAEYAKTTFPVDFKCMVQKIMQIPIEKLKSLGGCRLPWDQRTAINIYIAAPDFDYIDTRPIDILCEALKYHNFVPHRPIKENGQVNDSLSQAERHNIYALDMNLLSQCQIVVAVLLYEDPGTLIEIGAAKAMGCPTFVYDPYKKVTNCMLQNYPDLVTNDADELMSKIFYASAKLLKL